MHKWKSIVADGKYMISDTEGKESMRSRNRKNYSHPYPLPKRSLSLFKLLLFSSIKSFKLNGNSKIEGKCSGYGEKQVSIKVK